MAATVTGTTVVAQFKLETVAKVMLGAVLSARMFMDAEAVQPPLRSVTVMVKFPELETLIVLLMFPAPQS